jgi:hypothetical protein
MALSVRVGILLENRYPQPGPGYSGDDLSEPPPEEVAPLGIIEVLHPLDESRRRQSSPSFGHVVAHPVVFGQRLASGVVRMGMVPMLVEHHRRRMKVHDHEAATGP